MSHECKIYLSDEGFGHIVRQSAVVDALRKIEPSIHFTLQTEKHLDTAKRIIPADNYINKFNNIVWHKQPNGSPDIAAIRSQFSNYETVSEKFIADEASDCNSDFILSDFVYEAFEVAAKKSIPSFGVSHFTWDWFFSKLYPPPLHTDLIYRMMAMADKATRLYFPPFTPKEILSRYKYNVLEVPLILRKVINHKLSDAKGRFKVLIVDSGAGVIGESIRKALSTVGVLDDFVFYVSEKFMTEQHNLRAIPENELLVDYISDMDLVIGRAGFNTICECIGLRTPMLLIGEAMNPEMNENIVMLKHVHLGSFISMHTFENELGNFLPGFLQHEYKFISRMIKEHSIETNGAVVIAEDILNHL